MTIITGLLGLAGRFAGQILNTTLGWATLLLFGKVPQSRQTLLLVIVFGSLVWVALVIGVVLPAAGSLLVASVPMSNEVDPNWVRIGMLIGALVLPVLIGVAAAVVSSDTTSRGPKEIVIAGLRGYPFAFALAVMLVLLAVVGIGRKIRALRHKWQDTHIPLMVKPGAYEAVLHEVTKTLFDAGLPVEERDAGAMLSGPPKLLDAIAGRGLASLVPDKLMALKGDDIEVLVYPSDVAMSGSREHVARARAALATHVSNAPAYLTTSAEAQKVEDLLDRIRDEARQSPPQQTLARFREVDEKLAALPVPYDEWQVLYRLRLQLERDARAAQDHGHATSGEEIDGTRAPRGRSSNDGLVPYPARLAIGLGGAALVAVDVALQLAGRRSTTNGKR